MRLKLLALSKKKLLVLVFICFYIAGICLSIFRIHEINKILVLLRNYLDSLPADKLADISIDTLVQQSPSYQKNLLEVLANYPTILIPTSASHINKPEAIDKFFHTVICFRCQIQSEFQKHKSMSL